MLLGFHPSQTSAQCQNWPRAAVFSHNVEVVCGFDLQTDKFPRVPEDRASFLKAHVCTTPCSATESQEHGLYVLSGLLNLLLGKLESMPCDTVVTFFFFSVLEFELRNTLY